MEDAEKTHNGKIKEIMSDWNYDSSSALMSVPVLDLEKVKCLAVVAYNVTRLH
jgi:hypothetical protein